MILPGTDPAALAAAAQCLRAGGLLGLPTETVYGLAADADNDAAVAQIFAAKGRPADHPLIVHVANAAAAEHYASDIPAFARALMAAFWPGPLTLILPRRPGVATAAAGGNPTVGLRCPAHPVAQALLQQLNWGQIPINSDLSVAINNWGQSPINLGEKNEFSKQLESDPNCLRVWGLAAPSANVFGRVSPTTAAHVQQEFGDGLLILDGGPCQVGIESTIIDCSRGQPVLLRPGAITPEQVQAVCGLKVLRKEDLPATAELTPKASGTLASHYAPRARVRLMAAPALRAALAEVPGPPAIGVWARCTLPALAPWVMVRPMPSSAAAAAQQLFATLRALDAAAVSQIWIEAPPDTPDWDGVRDRLQRASFVVGDARQKGQSA